MADTNNISEEITRVKQRFGIIGDAPALIEAMARAVRVAPIDLSVLVTGESGAGKEVFPKIIHQYGARKHKKYIAVNCGAIPEGTIDSELFGHEKGSFTGAIATRKGYFEEADGGTLFLDEVAELPLTTQARLLRVLESGEFIKVGSSTVQKTDVRIVAATNVNLLEAVRKGKFREDLYYRLSTVTIEVPNLHDRGEGDIHLLARKFASDFSRKYMTEPITFSADAVRTMALYRWPGNVRQLKNVVEQLALFHAGEEIDRPMIIESLPIDHSGLSTPVHTRHNAHDYESERQMLWQMVLSLKADIRELQTQLGERNNHRESNWEEVSPVTTLMKYSDADLLGVKSDSNPNSTPLAKAEKQAIEAALARNNGNKRKTAEELNISVRTLYRKLQEYDIQ
ncbi:MAG: sigma-54 dependent transcriptional regulator [Muribaculaceae bacterium]|nr:sigma-54 dependent transcriptional regulator [Muribaculaceae bacterium]